MNNDQRYGKRPSFTLDLIVHEMERLYFSQQFLEADGRSGPMLFPLGETGVRLCALHFLDGQSREMKIQAAIWANGTWPSNSAILA
ncbi:hypothetical protein GCM10007382_28460 [Salinibacterium xinjiangense]|uniref:Uncharacterized protein n=1 Tax=Salinibacterium xinjiangense TaxID=386302 RepID=A0A2C8ZTD7_9MICO|nr:hypothetical protein [Salinibacterium xinjiangense]GGL06759.1 hypothetical protein GCM10007382_28460 [Salinibacterium xinjiangense]SOE68878.1 hypothetical protein SAMN06296378_1859 [Salinibacterium xinjiangense]